MAAYRRDYDSRHLQADCKEPKSAPEPYAWLIEHGLPFTHQKFKLNPRVMGVPAVLHKWL